MSTSPPTARTSRRWRNLFHLVACAAAAFLAGCTPLKEYVHNGFKVGPNYRTPPAATAHDWIDAADSRVRKGPDDQTRWWTVFNDPVLNALVCDAYRQNLTLREAGFRVLQARAQLGIARGELFPQYQAAVGGFAQQAMSREVANRAFIQQRFFSNWNYGFGLNWELDFWGRFRRAVESADAQLDASVADYDDVLVTLLGDVATSYVQLRTLEQQLVYVRANVKLQKDTLAIALAQFKGGQVSEIDPAQAQSTLSQTEAEVPQLEVGIRQTANRLCVLLGIPPEELQKRLGPGEIPTAPPEAVVGAPADLLRRRPDVRQAERLAAAQAAEIGIAEADFYPAVSLAGSIGASAQEFSNLFVTKAMMGNIGPSFQWNVLNYGRIRNNVRLQDARFQAAVANYRQTVLSANAEVEDGLVAFLKAHDRVAALAESVRAAEKAVKAAVVQYTNGLIDFNRVALLQQNLVTQQSLLAAARGEIALGLVQTYRAIGGGWEIRRIGCEPPPAAPPPNLLPPPLPELKAVDALGRNPVAGNEPTTSRPKAAPSDWKPVAGTGSTAKPAPIIPAVSVERVGTAAPADDPDAVFEPAVRKSDGVRRP